MTHRRFLPLAALCLALAGCGSAPPGRIDNVCAVFEQRSGLMRNWERDARRAERAYGVPLHVLMATMRIESGFDGDARPPRRTILGVVPWTRPSTAYGFSQALDGTWAQYRKETGNGLARRDDFGSSVDFVGWYYQKTMSRYGVAHDDAYTLYLSYRVGWTGYARGGWRNDAAVLRDAQKVSAMASNYRAQLAGCD